MTHPIDAASAAAWYNQPSRRFIWSLPFSVGLSVVFIALLLRSTAEDPVANEAASRAALLALAPAPVPKEDDAWEDYKLAAKVQVLFSGKYEDDPFSHISDESKFFEAAAVQAYWQANAKTITLLQQGSQKSRCSFGVDYKVLPWDMPYGPFRGYGKLLAVDARCLAHKGDHIGAAKSIRAILRLSEQVEQPRVLISGLVSVASEAHAYGAVQAILVFDTPTTVADLAAYRQALVPPKNVYQRMLECTKGEMAFTLWNWDVAQSTGKVAGASHPLMYGRDRRCYVTVMNDILAMFNRKELLTDIKKEAMIERYQTGPIPETRSSLPNSRYYVGFVNFYESAILTDVALAFLQYRIQYGHDVKELSELVPEFLKAIPEGVTAGQPVRMRRGILDERQDQAAWFKMNKFYKGKTWIQIYSTGYNGVDDGGVNFRHWDDPTSPDDNSVLIPLLPEDQPKTQP